MNFRLHYINHQLFEYSIMQDNHCLLCKIKLIQELMTLLKEETSIKILNDKKKYLEFELKKRESEMENYSLYGLMP